MIPMDFGTNRSKRVTTRPEVDFGEPDQELDVEQANTAIRQSVKEDGVKEERMTVKDLYNLEKQQKNDFDNWKKKEEEFEYKQMILRSKIRVESGRGVHIDYLAKMYLVIDGHLAIGNDFKLDKVRKPYLLFGKLKVDQMQSLKSQIDEFLNSRHNSAIHDDYWPCIKTLHDVKVQSLNEEQYIIDSEIQKELDILIDEKSIDELKELEVEIVNNLDDPDFSEEIDYWHT